MTDRKIYDGFTFYNEFELLEWRLKMLYDIVDCFVIVESDRTFQNKPKPLYFAENKERFAKYLDKIRYIPVTDEIKCEDNWSIEIFQRNCIARGLDDCSPQDIVMMGDIDEFPDPRVLEALEREAVSVRTFLPFGEIAERSGMRGLSRNGRCFLHSLPLLGKRNKIMSFLEKSPVVSEQRMFEFYVNYECASHWCGTILTLAVNLGKMQQLRRMRNNLPMIQNGWHFSSMGGTKAVLNKFRATSDGMGNPVFKLPLEEQEAFVEKELAAGRIWWRNETLIRHAADALDIPYINWLAEKYGFLIGKYN